MRHVSNLVNGSCHSHASIVSPSVVSPLYALLPSGQGGGYLYFQPVSVPAAHNPNRLSKPSSDRYMFLTDTFLPHGPGNVSFSLFPEIHTVASGLKQRGVSDVIRIGIHASEVKLRTS